MQSQSSITPSITALVLEGVSSSHMADSPRGALRAWTDFRCILALLLFSWLVEQEKGIIICLDTFHLSAPFEKPGLQ